MADRDALAEDELRVNATDTVGAARGGVDLANDVGQPGMTESPRGRSPRAPSVMAGFGDAQNATGEVRRQTLLDDHLDGREPTFGQVFPFSSSAALR